MYFQLALGICSSLFIPAIVYLYLVKHGCFQDNCLLWALCIAACVISASTILGIFITFEEIGFYFFLGFSWILGNTIFFCLHYFKHTFGGRVAVLRRRLKVLKNIIIRIEKENKNSEINEELISLKEEYKIEEERLMNYQFQHAKNILTKIRQDNPDI